MASKKASVDTKPKATVTAIGVAPAKKQENGAQGHAPTSETGFGKVGKTKKTQASKEADSSPVQELEQKPSSQPVEMPTETPLPTPEKAGKVKATKAPKEIVDPTPVQIAKKGSSEATSEKPAKMKRLTLDIAKPLHKAIKARAVEEGVPMVDMLRSLLEEHYRK